ncbi:MAG: hypothetical protein ACEQSR_15135, partial [Candidatus Methylacidiphilales bacterium]
KCTGEYSIVDGDIFSIIKHLTTCCGGISGAKIPITDLDNNVTECVNGQFNYGSVSFDLTPYGGGSVIPQNASELIAAFAALTVPINVNVIGCNIYLPIDYAGDILPIEVTTILMLRMYNLLSEEATEYPRGVFNVNGDYLGIANSQAEYVTIWNGDVDNQLEGVLSASTLSPFDFILSPIGTPTITGVIGLRFWKFDTQANKKFRVLLDTDDVVLLPNGTVLSGLTDSINLTRSQVAGDWSVTGSQSYPRAFLSARAIDYTSTVAGTVYVFHNDTDAPTGLMDNFFIPGGGGSVVTTNLSGYLPKRTKETIISTNSFLGNKWVNILNWTELTENLSILNLNLNNGANTNNTSTIPLFTHMSKLKHFFTIFLSVPPTVYSLTNKNIFPDLGALLIPFGRAGSHPLGDLTNLPTKLKQISTGISVNANGNTSAQNDQYFIDLDTIFNTTPNPDFPNQMIICWSGLNNRTSLSDVAYNSLISKGVYIVQQN